MTTETQPETYKCDNCEWSGTRDECNDVDAYSQRFTTGDRYTSAQCPECGALAFPVEPTKPPIRILVVVSGGCVTDVMASEPMDVTLRDFDNIKAGDTDPIPEGSTPIAEGYTVQAF